MHKNPFPDQIISAIGYLLTSQAIPCIYYGTEQGFDGGGDADFYVRECMFGGTWGAFDTTGVHFFNEQNPIYRGIRSIAGIRAQEPALRYGRQYFREISGDGSNFGYPGRGNGTLRYSRILDTDEVLVVINLAAFSRHDCVTVDRNLTPTGSQMIDLLGRVSPLAVQDSHRRAYVRVPLQGHQIAILKSK
jgi:glycosidase